MDNSLPQTMLPLGAGNKTSLLAMTTRNAKTDKSTDSAQKLRQTQAEYSAARPPAEPGAKTMMSSSKMYVCRRCQANFKTGDGRPDVRMAGLGKCNPCLALAAASAASAGSPAASLGPASN